MKRIVWLLALLAVIPARAADNVAVTPGSGKTIACLDISTVCFAKYIPYDTTGAAFGVTGNPFFVVSTTLATAANQATANSSLSTIATNTGAPPPLGTSGGWTPTALTAITNSSQTVKGSAGQLGYALCDNPNNAWSYLQFFNATSPSVGTNVGFIPLPPNLSGGMTLSVVGLQFSNSIKVAATTTPTGSTAPGTNLNCSFGYN